jgi:hypothetical protein
MADALASEAMATLNEEIYTTKLVAGHDHSADLEDIKFQTRELTGMDLTDGEFDAKLSALRSERDRLSSLPSVPDSVERVPTGQTYASKWAGLAVQERGDWLRSAGVKFYVSKDASAIPALMASLTEKLAKGEDKRYAVQSREGVTLVVWFGTLEAL